MTEPQPAKEPFDLMASLSRAREKLDQESPILDTRYYINYAWDERNGWDSEWERRVDRVGRTFASAEEANKYLVTLKANMDNRKYSFVIGEEHLREYHHRRWGI